MDQHTWTERPPPPTPRCAVLIYVLSYEDLLRRQTVCVRLEHQRLPFTIGRATDDLPPGLRAPNELRAADRWMSGGHAVLDRRGGKDVLRDLGSRNGSFVNGVRRDEHALADGDLIELGHSLFVYRMVDAPPPGALDGAAFGPTRTFNVELVAGLSALGRVAPAGESVLALGETGTGKEVLAEAVHALSGRRGPMRSLDCGAIHEALFESTLFGHRRGAFTGAAEARQGEVTRADGGSLFLDEVGNLPPALQAKLLRVIERGEVTPLGASDPEKVDVRWIAATNRELFGDDGFRSDLLRRLSGHVVRLPPLRRRREDLGELCACFLAEAGATRASITVPAARKLFADPLPGNVRQLRAALRSAFLIAGDQPIDLQHLPAEEPGAAPASPTPAGPPGAPEIERALTETGGNVVRAAQRLGTHPRQLYRWIEKLELSLDRFRG